MQGLLLGQLSGFRSEVSIFYAAFGSGGVLRNALQVGHGAGEAVLYGTQLRTLAVDLLHGIVQSLGSLLRSSGSQDVQVRNAGLHGDGGFSTGASNGGQAQCSQASAGATILNGDVFVSEQVQGAVSVFAGLNTGAGAVDRRNDRVSGVTLLELDFNAVYVNRGISGQLGLSSTSRQTQLRQRTTGGVGQLNVCAITRSQLDTAVSESGRSTSSRAACRVFKLGQHS